MSENARLHDWAERMVQRTGSTADVMLHDYCMMSASTVSTDDAAFAPSVAPAPTNPSLALPSAEPEASAMASAGRCGLRGAGSVEVARRSTDGRALRNLPNAGDGYCNAL